MTTSANGFTGTQFQSAVHRRRGKGPILNIAHWVFDGPDDETGHEVAHDMMIDPRLDVIRFGEVFGSYGTELKAAAESMTGEADDKAGIEGLQAVTRKGVARLRDCIVPTQRHLLDEVEGALDATMISHIVAWIAKELSPLDPTQPALSSDGSDTTSGSSTAGAQLDASTLPAPLSPVA